MTFAIRRGRAQAGRLVVLVAIGLLVVLGIGGVNALAARTIDDGVRRVVSSAEPRAAVMEVIAARAPDPAAQDADIREAIAQSFPTPVAVRRQAVSVLSSGNADALQVLADDDISTLGDLVEGDWPRSSDEAAILERAAQDRGIGVGDAVELGPVDGTVTVVGVWTARDAAAAEWNGNPAVGSGRSGTAAGPLVLTGERMDGLESSPTVTWTIRPVDVGEQDLEGLRRGIARLAALPQEVDPQNQRSTRIEGGLAETVDRASTAIAGARGLLIVPLLLIGVLGMIATGVVLVALAHARSEDLFLLRSRGASAAGIAGHAAAETAIATGAGAAAGLLVLALAGASGWSGTIAALTIVAGAAVVAAVTALAAARRGDRRDDAGKSSTLLLVTPWALTAAAAALALWQLFAAGSFRAEGGGADPLASAAPALLLLAAGLLVPLTAGPLAALAERVARRGRGLVPVLPLRQVARRAGSITAAALCLSLGAGAAALAASAPAHSAEAERRTLSAALGADVRVVLGGTGFVGADQYRPDAGAVATLPGVTAVTEVRHQTMALGGGDADFVAADPDFLPLPAAARGPADGDAVPAVITSALAARLGAVPGDTFSGLLRRASQRFEIRVVAVATEIPGIGTAPGVAADRAAIAGDAGTEFRPDELWLRTGDPETVADELRSVLATSARILTPSTASVAPLVHGTVLLLTAGAAVAAVIAVLGAGAAIAQSGRRRDGDRRILRALGMTDAAARAARAVETASVVLFSVLGGVLAGVAVGAVVLPFLGVLS